MLSVRSHIAVAGIILFATFGLTYLIDIYLYSHGWGGFHIILLSLIPCAVTSYLFDRYVPAECPECGGKMYGDGSTHRWKKKCSQCGYTYSQ